jgi:2-dehydro-3-deoxygluconokinase
MSSEVVTFGEVLLRLTTPKHERFSQARQFDVIYGGTECNVAVALSNWGVTTHHVTAAPDNDIGQACVAYIRQFGPQTSFIKRLPGRQGLYFLEAGASVRASKVVYDRAGSSFSMLRPGVFDWREIFKGKHWFHFTGISAAVSDGAAAVCAEAAGAARQAGLMVSCDLNYRSALWTPERARPVMRQLMKDVDVLLGGREDADKCLGVVAGGAGGAGLDYSSSEQTALKLKAEFGFKKVALTMRAGDSADENEVSAVYLDGDRVLRGRKVLLRGMVDRVGGGDAFSAGMIFGNLQGWESQKTLDFAVASGAIKHTVHGDFNIASVSEVESVLAGGAAGRVQR